MRYCVERALIVAPRYNACDVNDPSAYGPTILRTDGRHKTTCSAKSPRALPVLGASFALVRAGGATRGGAGRVLAMLRVRRASAETLLIIFPRDSTREQLTVGSDYKVLPASARASLLDDKREGF